MKRFLIVLLFVILFTLSFAACGEGVKMQDTGENGQTVVDNNDKDKTEEKNPNMGDVNIDVEQPVDENRNDNPCIDGDVAIIPGVKGEDE